MSEPMLKTRDGRRWRLRFTADSAELAREWTGLRLETFARMTPGNFFLWCWEEPANAWLLAFAALDADLAAAGLNPREFVALVDRNWGDVCLGVALITATRLAMAKRFPESPLGRALL